MTLFTGMLFWYLTLIGLSLVGLPISLTLFRSLPDHGYPFSRALGLLFTGYVAWLLTIFGFTRYSINLLLFLVLALGAAGWFLLPQRQAQLATLRESWRQIVAYEILFLVSFLFLAWVRTYEPNPQGTERPMDFALFNAIMRSPTFPPHDPWLSGYAINYYYLGYLLMGLPTLLSRVDPGVGYNLSLATLFALTAVHVASLVYNLIALQSQRESRRVRAKIGTMGAPLLGVLLVLTAGNQAGVLEVLTRTEKVVALDAQQTWVAIANGLEGDTQTLHLPYATLPSDDFGAIQDVQLQDEWDNFNWWWPSRALWDDYVIGGIAKRIYNITEFPFFSFYLGDMHPHVMALPFTVLVAALVLGWMAHGTLPTLWNGAWPERIIFVLSAVIVGSLYFLNSWDLPTYVLFFILGFLWVRARLSVAADQLSWKRWAASIGAFLLACILLYVPFYLNFQSFAGATNLPSAIDRIPVVRTLATMVGIVFWSKSSLHQELIIFGLFALPVGAYLAVASAHLPTSVASAYSPAEGGRAKFLNQPRTWGALTLFSFLVGTIVGFPLLGLVPVAVYSFRIGLTTCEISRGFVYLGVALLSFILVGADLFFIPDVFGTRMNTIFKFYYQVWTFGGVLAAYTIWSLVSDYGSNRFRFIRSLALTLFGILFAGAMVYPVLALRERMQGTSQGLTGITAREAQNVGEREAVEWLRAHAPSDAVLLEAVGASYDGTGTGAASLAGATGLQTVLGWPGHEDQWRHGNPSLLARIPLRQADVQTIYTSSDIEKIRALLAQYQIGYVVMGNAERRTYPGLNTRVLDQLMARAFVSSDRNVVIWGR